MDTYYRRRLLAISLAGLLTLTTFTLTSVLATEPPEYDLTIPDIPCVLGDETFRIDTQTNDRGFLISNDGVTIRSQYLTFYELNNSYEHDDINYVVGGYCYTPEIPAQNATLDTIIEINRFQLSSWNGTVTVQRPTQYSENRMVLTVNSSDNATLLIRAVDLHRNYEYRIIVDDVKVGWIRVNSDRYFDYNYTGDWSNHTITFQLTSKATEVPAEYLGIIQVMLCMGVFIVVIKSMVLPLKKPGISQAVMTRTLIKASVYIIVASAMIVLVFQMFAGV